MLRSTVSTSADGRRDVLSKGGLAIIHGVEVRHLEVLDELRLVVRGVGDNERILADKLGAQT